jgi:FkbM family methyltransferase
MMTRLRFIHRGLKTRYIDHYAELSALLAALSPRDVVVDVGAHKGSYLWSLSRAVPKGRAIAFEPQPYLASYLLRACRAARLDNVVIEAVGVSAQSGKANLSIPGAGRYLQGASLEPILLDEQTSHVIEVPTVSLDDYFSAEKSNIGAIKIDVEGHEMQVLKGAERLITIHRPTILCESEDRHRGVGSVAELLDFMAAQDYNGFFFQKSKLHPITEFNPRIHQKQVGNRYWDAPDYRNNFIFRSHVSTVTFRDFYE